MNKNLFIGLLLFLAGCGLPDISYTFSFKKVGSPTGNKTWIYLCGLLTDFIPEEMEELKVLDAIGKERDITFLALIPQKKCLQLNNCLCWPHDTHQEMLETYQAIINSVNGYSIHGYIGFSNGGFFLNKLAQFIKIDKPILSIGAAGPLFNTQGPLNTLHLLIGKKDNWHYEQAINLYEQSKNTNLTIHLIEYDEGHTLPKDVVENIIKTL